MADCDNGEVDVMFALPSDLDTINTAHVLNFIRSITYIITYNHQGINIGVIPKDCYFNPGFHLKSGQELIHNRDLLDVNIYTSSNTASLLRHMREHSFREENGGRHNAKRIGVLIVDKASYDVAEAQFEAQHARRSEGIEIYVIVVGGGVNDAELEALSSDPTSNHVIHVNAYCDLLTINLQLVRQSCSSDKDGEF